MWPVIQEPPCICSDQIDANIDTMTMVGGVSFLVWVHALSGLDRPRWPKD